MEAAVRGRLKTASVADLETVRTVVTVMIEDIRGIAIAIHVTICVATIVVIGIDDVLALSISLSAKIVGDRGASPVIIHTVGLGGIELQICAYRCVFTIYRIYGL